MYFESLVSVSGFAGWVWKQRKIWWTLQGGVQQDAGDFTYILFFCDVDISQVTQARNMSIGEHRHNCCVTFKI